MGITDQEAIREFHSLMDKVDDQLMNTFQLIDCLQWRTQNEIDSILAKPIFPTELYRSIRDTQLVGLSGHSKQGLPVVACGVGQSTYDKASVHYYVQSHIQMNEYRDRVVLPNATKKYGRHIGTCIKILDMTGLRLSALNQIKLLTAISTIDDLNYPEKTETYYIVNVPYIFSACWKVVKPLLQERTRKKIQVLQGSGKDELLKARKICFRICLYTFRIMDYSSLPHFSRKEGSGSSRVAASGTTTNCFSLDHPLHQQLYNYVKQQADLEESASPLRQGSVHVDYPEPDPTDAKIMKTIESELHKLSDMKGLNKSFSRV
ncbi:Phosphatidylinositol/phosphatidylcholine transfer protein SFH2 [Linum perenne]